MADLPITSRKARFGEGFLVFDHYQSANEAAGATKYEWVCPIYGRIVDVIIDSETAGTGGSSDIADVNINGTTVYTTQANRPTIASGDTGLWTEAGEPEVSSVRPGDILSYDLDQKCTTNSSSRRKIAIIVEPR